MRCPFCQSVTRVIDSREHEKGIRRRRECPECLSRFPTYETITFTEMDKHLLRRLMDTEASRK